MTSASSAQNHQASTAAGLLTRLERLPELANRDEALLQRGRFVTLEFQVVIGSLSCFISIVEGRVAKIERGPRRMRSSAFIISASAAAWEKFWLPTPPPWSHDLFAMNKKGNATIEGDLHPLMANLQYFKDLLALARRITGAR